MATVTSLRFDLLARDRVSATARGVGATFQRLARQATRDFDTAAGAAERLTSAVERLDKISRRGGMMTAAAAAAALAKAASPAVAAVAALPAALAAAGSAAGALKLGLSGVGDAMGAVAEGDAEKLRESLEGLSPAARRFVQQAASMRSQLVSMQQAVQEGLFAGLDRELARLGSSLLPTVKTGLTEMAGELNGVALEATRVASTPWFRGQLEQVMTASAGVMATLSEAVRPAIEMVTRLTVAGMPLLQRMAEWTVNGIKAASAFVRLKDESGRLAATIDGIGSTLEAVGRIGRNVALTIAELTRQANAFGLSGAGFVATLEQGSAAMLTWAQSAEGQQQTALVWQTLSQSAGDLAAVLPILTGAIGVLADALNAMPAPLRDAVSQTVAFGLAASVVSTQLMRIPGAAKLVGAATAGITKAAGAARVAMVGFVAGMRNVNLAYAANATLATRLGAAIRSQIMLWRQQAAAAGVSTARIIAQAAAQRVAAAATRVWAAAQAAFNAVMSANPIALAVVAIAGLAAAIVVAYKKSETFRNIVQSTWDALKTGVAVMWSFIQPILSAIGNFLRGVLGVAFTVFGNLVKLVWINVQLQIKVAWAIIQPVLNAFNLFIRNVLGPAFRWLLDKVVKPVWNTVGSHISAVWNAGVKPVLSAVRNFLATTLGNAFKGFRTTATTVWNALRSTISTVWNGGIKPAFNALKSAVGSVRSAFQTAVNGIRKIWDGLRDIAKKPVNFVIGIYNDGIVNLVNRIAKFAGIGTRLDKIPKFARGGVMPGYAPGRDTLLAAVSPGESIFRPEFTRAVGAQWVQRANEIARRGGPRAVREWLVRGGDRLGGEGIAFARGGTVPGFAGAFKFGGIVSGFMRGLKDFAFGNVEKAFKSVLGKIIGKIPGSGIFRDVIAGIPARVIDTLVRWFRDKVGFGGGPSFQRALAFAKAQAGKPYVWGGVGPGGFDCSGFMSAILNVIEGKNPYQRRFTTFSFTGASRGPAGFIRNKRSAFEVGVTNAGVGHMAGTLLGHNVESRGSVGVVVGSRARGAGDALFPMRYGLSRDNGGRIPPGQWLVNNGTGRDEYVFTKQQLDELLSTRGEPVTYNYTTNVYPQRADFTLEDLRAHERRQRLLSRAGRP